jgi:hypothetical protein
MADRDIGEEPDRRVIVDLAAVEDAAVAMVGVLAGADVADDEHLRGFPA